MRWLTGAIKQFLLSLSLRMKKGSRTAGTVESFDNRIDPNTGKILLRAIFPNPQGRIVPGLFARIPSSFEENAIGTDQSQ